MSFYDLYTIGSSASYISSQLNIPTSLDYKITYQARPGMTLPIVLKERNQLKWIDSIWDQNEPSIHIKQTLKGPPYNFLIRQRRCVIPVNCFFLIKETQPYLVRILGHRLFCMGGIYDNMTQANNRYNYKILTTNSADVLSNLNSHMPVLFECSKANEWLNAQSMQDVMGFSDYSTEYWFDYFKVSKDILLSKINNKDHLKPLGYSKEQIMLRERQLMALKIKKDRADRGSSKR